MKVNRLRMRMPHKCSTPVPPIAWKMAQLVAEVQARWKTSICARTCYPFLTTCTAATEATPLAQSTLAQYQVPCACIPTRNMIYSTVAALEMYTNAVKTIQATMTLFAETGSDCREITQIR